MKKKYFFDWRKRKENVFATYNVSRKLRDEGKSSDELEAMIGNLTLEELIGLKLHLSSKTVGGKFYGFPLWSSMVEITRDALLKYAWSCARTRREAGLALGLRGWNFVSVLKKYRTDSYFQNLCEKNQQIKVGSNKKGGK